MAVFGVGETTPGGDCRLIADAFAGSQPKIGFK